MTQTLKKHEYKPDLRLKGRLQYSKNQKKILNYLFRTISFQTRNDKIRTISNNEHRKISKETGVSFSLIKEVVNQFLENLIRINQFLNEKENVILLTRNKALYIRIHLHRLYRLAPVFDYKRARENARILRKRLEILFFEPRMTTQVAVIVYITDFLDPHHENKIIQSNLRNFCACSAYAFHRTRNKIGLNPKNIRKSYLT